MTGVLTVALGVFAGLTLFAATFLAGQVLALVVFS